MFLNTSSRVFLLEMFYIRLILINLEPVLRHYYGIILLSDEHKSWFQLISFQ